MKNRIVLFFLIIINISLYSQTPVPISDLRYNDSNGVPVDTGKYFTISGVVTSANQFGNSGPGSVQDLTGAISIYGSGFANQVIIGDSVTVYAKLTHFRGLTQLDYNASGSRYTKHSSSHTTEPQVLTIADIKNQQWNGFEEHESKLIRINNVTIQNASGNFASGTNYTIFDLTDTLTNGLRIDNDVSSIIGTPIPSGKIDIIGILGQYRNYPPYTSDYYQLLPRFIQDIVVDGSPLILTPIIAADIDTNSFTVYFKTARNGNSQVKYGLTPSLEIDSVIINDDTTFHQIKIEGLSQATTYYYQAISSNEVGRSESPIQTVTTASSNPLIGTINVYFNYPVDTTIAILGNSANGNVNFKEKLLNRINLTNHSIDMAVYSFFNMEDVADALIIAKNRGVKVRVVYDSRQTQNSMQLLINAGIQIIKRPTYLDGIMHNKFFIFDARDTIQVNDWLWTGSWNPTATELNWKNNVVEINDPTITQAYLKEFEEMWGSNTDTPNSSNAKFGNQKTDNTPHFFNIGGKTIEVYFSPSDNTTSKIINSINSANENVYMAMYAITRTDIKDALYNRYTSGMTDIRGLIDQVNTSGSVFNDLDVFAEMYNNQENTGITLHHKYSIIDQSNASSDPIVITGSHNWSNSAENDNDENTLIIHDVYIANQYVQEFKKRYNENGGTNSFVTPIVDVNDEIPIVQDFKLYQNYPNPFNPSTKIKYTVPKTNFVSIKIYDILGKEISTLVNEEKSAGTYEVEFNANGLSSGMSAKGGYASGVYFYKLGAGDFMQVKKMIMLK